MEPLEEKALPVGTTRKWADGNMYKKLGPGNWQPVPKGGGSPSGPAAAPAKPAAAAAPAPAAAPATPAATERPDAALDPRGAIAHSIKSGELRGTVEEHARIAGEFLGKHSKSLNRFMGSLSELAPKDAKVKARVKDVESALGKLARKPKYGDATKLQDGTGARVICHSIDEVKSTVEKLKKKYKVVNEDDYITKPQGDYRSHHLIVEDDDGLQKEIQVRTENQNTFADWSHNVYKPHTREQSDTLRSSGKEIGAYSKAMGDYLFDQDSGKRVGDKPPCPPPVKAYFGCL